MSQWIDIGGGVDMQWARCDADPSTRCMVMVRHWHPDGNPCVAGVATLAVPCRAGLKENYWRVTQVEPLTVAPSLDCPCGLHGSIVNGRWT